MACSGNKLGLLGVWKPTGLVSSLVFPSCLKVGKGFCPSLAQALPATVKFRRRFCASLAKVKPAASTMASAQKKVLVPIGFGIEEMEVVILVDVLRRAGSDVTVASVETDLQIEASRRVKLVADTLISNCTEEMFDLVVLPGGMPGSSRLRDCEILQSITKKQAADGRLYGAVCAAPAVVLETWGLLKGLRATCHPSFISQLSSSLTVGSRVQRDGIVTTSRGPGTTMEFALSFVEQLYGKEKAEEVAKPMVMRTKGNSELVKQEFNRVEWSFSTTPRILVPIANGSEEMEAVIIIDVLRRANADVVVASVEETLEIVASRKVKIVADKLIEDASSSAYDLIVLPEKKATAHPAFTQKIADQSAVGTRVVIDGNLITSRGPGTTMEFALAIVDKIFGQEKATGIAEAMVFPYP